MIELAMVGLLLLVIVAVVWLVFKQTNSCAAIIVVAAGIAVIIGIVWVTWHYTDGFADRSDSALSVLVETVVPFPTFTPTAQAGSVSRERSGQDVVVPTSTPASVSLFLSTPQIVGEYEITPGSIVKIEGMDCDADKPTDYYAFENFYVKYIGSESGRFDPGWGDFTIRAETASSIGDYCVDWDSYEFTELLPGASDSGRVCCMGVRAGETILGVRISEDWGSGVARWKVRQ